MSHGNSSPRTSKHLKLRRAPSVVSISNPQEYDDVECCAASNGGNSSSISSSSCSPGHNSSELKFLHEEDRKDKPLDHHHLHLHEYTSEFTPFSRRIIRFVTPSSPLRLPNQSTSTALTVAILQTLPALVLLFGLPYLIWDAHPTDWSVWNVYPVVRHVDMVWSSLLHVGAWPVGVVTVGIVMGLPSSGGGRFGAKFISGKGSSSSNNGWMNKLLASSAGAMANISQSHWKMSLVVSLILLHGVIIQMVLQMAYPSLLWNPFMWGWYTVYHPANIAASLKGACLDFSKHSTSRQPLCLEERQWKELSSGQLSSSNPDDVLTVQKGLDYLQNQSGGVLINALARNVADAIPALRMNMEGLAPFFNAANSNNNSGGNKLSLVIFENDSNDGTRELFNSWADEAFTQNAGYDVDIINCGPKNPNCELGIMDRYDNMNLFTNPTASGVGKLGEFRQIALDYIMKKAEYKEYSHMIVLDVDLGTSISPLGLLHTLGLEGGITQNHVVASSSSQVWPGTMGTIIPPYDLSAFRPEETLENKRSTDDVTTNHRLPYQVTSAFNGLTIYPLSLIRERGSLAKYDSGDDNQRCEHVGFHLSLNKPMYVNPKWTMNLKPSKPGGPTGWRAIKTLVYAVFGRPNVMFAIVFGNLVFFWMFVSAFWLIGLSLRGLWGVFVTGSGSEKRMEGRSKDFDVSGIETREM
eukprot:g5592.t1 g5592   contig2:870434-872618(+)